MIRLVTAPTVEPILLTPAKLYLKVDNTTDDTLITEMIKASRQAIEDYLGYKLITQTWDYFQDEFTDPLIPNIYPLQSVAWIKYQDADNVTQTVSASDYNVFTNTFPAQIKPVVTTTFPIEGDYPAAVNVRCVVGFGDATADIPQLETILRAIKLVLGEMYENRENVQPSHSAVKLIPNCARKILMNLRSFH
jgi:uncharacterized phiE125 gp8 family phage protein